jgi:dihydrolipoamide dehydrogenase
LYSVEALLESSERFIEARDSLGKFGVKINGSVDLDLDAMLARKDDIVKSLTDGVAFLFKKNKVERYTGDAQFVGPNRVRVGEEEIEAKHIIIATGSKSAPLRGIEFDDDIIGNSTRALSYETVPEHLVVIGGGYIGVELGSVWKRLGAKVTVLEYLPFILPGLDREIADEAFKIFKNKVWNFGWEPRFYRESLSTGKACNRNRGRRADYRRSRSGCGGTFAETLTD